MKPPKKKGTPAPDSDRYLTIKQVADMLQMSESYIYRLKAEDLFPAPARFGRASRWSERAVLEWARAQVA